MDKKTDRRERPESKDTGAGNDYKNMQDMREDIYTAGKCSALAGLLSGVQGEVPAGGYPYQKVPEMREDLYFPVKCRTLAEILPGMPEKACRRIQENQAQSVNVNDAKIKKWYSCNATC